MIAMGMTVVVLMYQQACIMDWSSGGGHDDRASSNYSDHCVMVHHNLVSYEVGVLMAIIKQSHMQTHNNHLSVPMSHASQKKEGPLIKIS